VSPNSRDGGFIENRTHAQNWGAEITIITHSNAGKPANPYNLVMWDSATDKVIAQKISANLGPLVPGPDNIGEDQTWSGVELAELKGNAPHGDAYVELQFHDVQSSQGWMYNNSPYAAYVYGLSVDQVLGFP
jgi:hypothetical protein